MTRALRVSLILSVALAAVLLSLLAVASGNNELLQNHYELLLWLNVAIAVGMPVALATRFISSSLRSYIDSSTSWSSESAL